MNHRRPIICVLPRFSNSALSDYKDFEFDVAVHCDVTSLALLRRDLKTLNDRTLNYGNAKVNCEINFKEGIFKLTFIYLFSTILNGITRFSTFDSTISIVDALLKVKSFNGQKILDRSMNAWSRFSLQRILLKLMIGMQ